MRRNVITVGVGDESETLRVPRIEPQVFLRQVNAAFVANIYHAGIYRTRLSCATYIDMPQENRFDYAMKFIGLVVGLLLLLPAVVRADAEPKLLTKVTPLPTALSDDFEFRKTKLYFLSDKPPKTRAQAHATSLNPGAYSSTTQRNVVNQDTSIGFERQYRLFGAVTALDQRQRFGDYFDFFWRAKRPADVMVRLEYRQQKLHDLVQAQEASYPNVHGNHKTEFRVIGDDYFDDGRVTAWRCLLIENGHIVAEKRSYMWE
jgi:hypothetical protein